MLETKLVTTDVAERLRMLLAEALAEGLADALTRIAPRLVDLLRPAPDGSGAATLLTPQQAAARCGVKIGTWYALLSQGRVPVIRLGPRLVRHDPRDLDQWIAAQRETNTPRQDAADASTGRSSR